MCVTALVFEADSRWGHDHKTHREVRTGSSMRFNSSGRGEMFRIKLGCSLGHSTVLIRLAHQCASADAGGGGMDVQSVDRRCPLCFCSVFVD